MLRSVRTPNHRLLAALVLALWMTPSAGALSVGLHVALGHHGSDHHRADHHGADHHGSKAHDHDLAEIARVALHGHHHDAEATPDHDHDATVDGHSTLLRPTPDLFAFLASTAEPGTLPAGRSQLDRPSRDGPPTLLFTAHCSLLL